MTNLGKYGVFIIILAIFSLIYAYTQGTKLGSANLRDATFTTALLEARLDAMKAGHSKETQDWMVAKKARELKDLEISYENHSRTFGWLGAGLLLVGGGLVVSGVSKANKQEA